MVSQARLSGQESLFPPRQVTVSRGLSKTTSGTLFPDGKVREMHTKTMEQQQ